MEKMKKPKYYILTGKCKTNPQFLCKSCIYQDKEIIELENQLEVLKRPLTDKAFDILCEEQFLPLIKEILENYGLCAKCGNVNNIQDLFLTGYGLLCQNCYEE